MPAPPLLSLCFSPPAFAAFDELSLIAAAAAILPLFLSRRTESCAAPPVFAATPAFSRRRQIRRRRRQPLFSRYQLFFRLRCSFAAFAFAIISFA